MNSGSLFKLIWLTLVGLALGLTQAHAQGACDQVVMLDRAQRTVWQDGRIIDQREVSRLDTLPREWRNERTRVRYRIAIDPCPGNDRGLWFYRIGAPYRAWLDGKPIVPIDPLAVFDGGRAPVYNGRVPALFDLPADSRWLEIELATVPYLGSGFVRASMGPQTALLEMRLIDRGALTAMNDTASLVVGVIGLMALLVWGMRRREVTVFWFAAACLTWALRGWAYQTFVYPLPPLWMEQINPWMVLTTVSCVCLSTLHALGLVRVPYARVMAGIYVACVALLASTLVVGAGAVPARTLTFALAFALVTHAMLVSARHWLRRREASAAFLSLGLLVLIIGSLHDLGMVSGFIRPDHWSLVTPAFTVLLLAYTAAASLYLGRNLRRAEQANEELERSIAAKSRELERSYERLRESERASAQAQERARLNREIHDGLGAQLITALRGVERGGMNQQQVAQTLQDGLDELRLLMDASDFGQGLSVALAAWRHRWDPRLQALDIALHWSVDPAVETLRLDADDTLQTMRVLQEAVTNAIKHARATSIRVTVRLTDATGSDLLMEVADDGIGPSPTGQGSGRGLSHMAQRAERLGARLEVARAASPGTGTVVRLHVPLQATRPRRVASSVASARELMPSLR